MIKRLISFATVVLIIVSAAVVPSVSSNAEAYENPFNDVPDDMWYTDAVLYCNANGFMIGTDEGWFMPELRLTRAMFMTVLSRIDGADTTSYTGSSFDDVPEDAWYATYVEWSYQNAYSSGTGNGNFSPDVPLTREQIAVFLFVYSALKGYDVDDTADLFAYDDASDVSSWAVTAMKWAVGAGLISGTSETTLEPKSAATRAQTATIIKNYINYVDNLPDDLLSRNGLKATFGFEIYKLPDDSSEEAAGKAYVRIRRSPASTVEFSDITVKAELVYRALGFTLQLPFNSSEESTDGYTYGEYAYEMSGMITSLPTNTGYPFVLNLTYTIGDESITTTNTFYLNDDFTLTWES